MMKCLHIQHICTCPPVWQTPRNTHSKLSKAYFAEYLPILFIHFKEIFLIRWTPPPLDTFRKLIVGHLAQLLGEAHLPMKQESPTWLPSVTDLEQFVNNSHHFLYHLAIISIIILQIRVFNRGNNVTDLKLWRTYCVVFCCHQFIFINHFIERTKSIPVPFREITIIIIIIWCIPDRFNHNQSLKSLKWKGSLPYSKSPAILTVIARVRIKSPLLEPHSVSTQQSFIIFLIHGCPLFSVTNNLHYYVSGCLSEYHVDCL